MTTVNDVQAACERLRGLDDTCSNLNRIASMHATT